MLKFRDNGWGESMSEHLKITLMILLIPPFMLIWALLVVKIGIVFAGWLGI